MLQRVGVTFIFVASLCLMGASPFQVGHRKTIHYAGPVGTFTKASITCGSGTCTQYSGSQSNVNVSGLGRVDISFVITENSGLTVASTPGGDACHSGEGTMTIITKGHLEIGFTFDGVTMCDAKDFVSAQFAAELVTGNSYAPHLGVADLTFVLDTTYGLAELVLDGGYIQ